MALALTVGSERELSVPSGSQCPALATLVPDLWCIQSQTCTTFCCCVT